MDFKQARIAKGLSIEELSKLAGVSPVYVRELEQFGDHNYSMNDENANKIVKVLGVYRDNEEYNLRLKLREKYGNATPDVSDAEPERVKVYKFDNNNGTGFNFSFKKPMGIMYKKRNTVEEEYLLPKGFTALYDRKGECCGVKTMKGEVIGDCLKTGKVPI